MAVWKNLLAKINKYVEKDLPKNLQRALEIFRIILKNKDIHSLDSSDLDKLKGEFPAMEVIKIIHRNPLTAGSLNQCTDFNNYLVKFILRGQWDKVIEYTFKDQHITSKFDNIGRKKIEEICERQRCFVRYLEAKGILTNEEARKLFNFIDNLRPWWYALLQYF
jgi:hypothetical protein